MIGLGMEELSVVISMSKPINPGPLFPMNLLRREKLFKLYIEGSD